MKKRWFEYETKKEAQQALADEVDEKIFKELEKGEKDERNTMFMQ